MRIWVRLVSPPAPAPCPFPIPGLLPAGPWVGLTAPEPLFPLLCTHPAPGPIAARMPGALGRTQGLVKKAAGISPQVCKLSSAFRHLLLLFVFFAVPDSLSLCCRCCCPAPRGPNKGVAVADGWWGSLDGLMHLPALRGRAGAGLVSEEPLHSQLVPGSWCLQVVQHREGAEDGVWC